MAVSYMLNNKTNIPSSPGLAVARTRDKKALYTPDEVMGVSVSLSSRNSVPYKIVTGCATPCQSVG